MKALKRIFYTLAIGLITVCSLVLVCALNPSLTKKLAFGLYGAGWQENGEAAVSEEAEISKETAASKDADPGQLSEDAQESQEDDEAVSLMNQSPLEPITWKSTWNGTAANEEASESERLAEAGITQEEVLATMEEYYADCLKQMTEAGSGEIRFSNVVPEVLWSSVERVYSDGSYKNGYVTKALEELDMEEFAIQLQGERLGGGYYRLHHSISTWN